MTTIQIYDTTLRDGSQGENISFSLEDKLRIASLLDDFGVHYIEGGWPGSNPKDVAFFKRAAEVSWKTARIAAFGSTRRAGARAAEDPNALALAEAATPVVTIFGKSWDLHVERALRTTRDENLRMIADTVSFLRSLGREVLYDAEHFFDGYRGDPDYALETLRAAEQAGAQTIVLCDTNGGSLVGQIIDGVRAAAGVVGVPLGIHTHNDSGLGVANALAAVENGAVHIQGTFNGYGERCGNANLTSILPTLQLKMGRTSIPTENLMRLTALARTISEIANVALADGAPYVGASAFAHKGGVHVSAVGRDPATYEHVEPEQVGNERRVLLSDLAGRAHLVYKAHYFGLEDGDAELSKKLVDKLKELEFAGYQFEGAEASFKLMVDRLLNRLPEYFQLETVRVLTEKRSTDPTTISEASVKLVFDGHVEHTAAEGAGPVNALDNALRKSLERFYPQLKEMRLVDYKVRVLDTGAATAAQVRVLIESSDGDHHWNTVGVSHNIIDASLQALLDSYVYKLQLGTR
ncbi:MAG: citramalate synthase [Acidobacteriota bacterium]